MACSDDAPLKFTPGLATDEVHAHATRRSCQFAGLGFPGRLMGRDSPAMWGGSLIGRCGRGLRWIHALVCKLHAGVCNAVCA
jgi:hypothetical protein